MEIFWVCWPIVDDRGGYVLCHLYLVENIGDQFARRFRGTQPDVVAEWYQFVWLCAHPSVSCIVQSAARQGITAMQTGIDVLPISDFIHHYSVGGDNRLAYFRPAH